MKVKKKNKNKPTADQMRLAKIKKKNASSKSAVKTNLFEIKMNKQKHNILNRKNKNHVGLPGVSRSAAIKKRQKTLLVEMDRKNNVSVVLDKRIGAGDSEMNPEEKMLQRMTKERMRVYKKRELFNLNDDEELTHLGKPISSMEDFNQFNLSDDEDDRRKEFEDAKNQFGGGFFHKKEDGLSVLDEIIVKSKKEKREKQQKREETENLFATLETQFNDNRAEHRFLTSSIEARKVDKEYSGLLGKLQSGRTCKATRIIKTPEQVAEEEREKVKKFEEERLRRMRGGKKDEKMKKLQSVDALCDEFDLDPVEEEENEILSFPLEDHRDTKLEDEDLDGNLILSDHDEEDEDEEDEDEEEEELSWSGDLGIVDDQSPRENSESQEEDDDDEDESDNFSDIDSGNEDLIEDSLSDHEVIEAERVGGAPKTSNLSNRFPETFDEFQTLVESSEVEVNKLISKLRDTYAPHLKEGNKKKMIELFSYIWQFSINTSNRSDPDLPMIDSLMSHLYELCEINTESCCDLLRESLKTSYFLTFKTSSNSQSTYSPHWPSIGQLFQFKMIKLIFPTSDFSHPVTSPALIFMCRMLQQCRITSLRDISRGLFIATLCYEYVSFSKRILPECINFLACILASALPHQDINSDIKLATSSRPFTKHAMCLLTHKIDDDTKIDPPNLLKALQCSVETEEKDLNQLKIQLLLLALKLCFKFATIYAANACIQQLFNPHIKILSHFKTSNNDLKQVIKSLLDLLEKKSKISRKKMSFGPSKPPMLPLIPLKLEESVGAPFEKRSRKTLPAKKEHDRLVHKLKKEKRGAIRELRKDNKFIASYNLKKQEELDEERASKVKRLMGLLSNQEGEVKSIKRQKYKLDL